MATKRYVRGATNLLNLLAPFLALTLGGSLARADLSSWPYAMKIDVSGYNKTDVLTNFPVLVVLSNNLAGFTYSAMNSPANGADLRFSVDTLNEINYEIDQWDTNGVSSVWVQIPAFQSNQAFYAHWGAAAPQPNYTTNGSTWSNNYVAVWHLGEQVTSGQSTGFHYDSTTNGNTGGQLKNGWTNGLIGRAQYFDRVVAAGINCGHKANLRPPYITIAAWVKPRNLTSAQYTEIYRKEDSNDRHLLSFQGNGTILSFGLGLPAGTYTSTNVPIAVSDYTGAWHHVAATYDGAAMILYRDGVEIGRTNKAGGALSTTATLNDAYIGRYSSGEYFDGFIDQVEISGVGRSSNWVWASYMQVASNQPFLAYTASGSLPVIGNQAATNLATTSACFNGYLSSTGALPTTVAVYYGTQDGGAPTSGLWQATNIWSEGAWAAGSFPTFQATPLTTDTFYYYRYAAWNTKGTNWAGTSSNVLVGAVSVTAPDNSASENGDTGTFRISRGATATNTPTAVFYRFTGSAALNTNYTLNPAGTNLTLAAGVASADITVTPVAELTNLNDTVVTLELLPGNFALGTTNASVTLSNVTPPAGHAATSLTWTDPASGTWDSFNTNHWTPRYIPNNGDSVNITNAFANNVAVDYTAMDFTGTNALNTLKLANATAGKTNSLLLGAGDTLTHKGGLTLDNGGRLEMSGGTLSFSGNAAATLNGGRVRITAGTWNVSSNVVFKLADASGQDAGLEVSGTGRLLMTPYNSVNNLNSTAGTSTLTLADSGEITAFRNIYVGTTGGAHTWTITGGALTRNGTSGNGSFFGNDAGNGAVTVTQSGGAYNESADVTIRKTATYNLTGGGLTNGGNLTVNGTLNQSGGTYYGSGEVNVGTVAGATGLYDVVSGTLRNRGTHIAEIADSTGTLIVRAAASWTTFNIAGTPGIQTFAIGATSGGGVGVLDVRGLTGVAGSAFTSVAINQTGRLQGWGTLTGTSYGNMNGKVIADGYGVDQTLNLTGRPLTNTVPNATDKGWYARNHGKLVLAAVAVNAATTNAYNWGVDKGDAAPTLVNSARLVFTGLTGSGSLTGAVLAVDRPEASASGNKVGAFEFGLTNSFASCDLTIRYDDAAAGANENDLLLYRWNGAAWESAAISKDLATHRVTAAGLTALGRFMLVYPQGAPVIFNQAATDITTTSAWLNGSLTSGDGATFVGVYWGTQDGGAPTSGLWQATNIWSAGAWTPGSFPTYQATPLSPDTFYYYRYAAWNSAGTNWPAVSSNVLVGAVSVTAPDASASESGDPGTFRIARGTTATNEPTTVFYRFTGSAVLNTNYTLTPAGTSLTLPAGVVSADITVNPLADLANNGDTVATLELLPGNYAVGTSSNASVTISNLSAPAAHSATNLTWTDSASGTWDSYNTNHWTPKFVPANGDSVFITNAFANNVAVDYYASANFPGTNALTSLTLGNPTAGKTNSLLLGTGDTLPYNGTTGVGHPAVTINAGGQLTLGSGALMQGTNTYITFTVAGGAVNMTGGQIVHALVVSPSNLRIDNGVWAQSGGTVTNAGHTYLADSAGQTAAFLMNGGAYANQNYDLNATAGNSTFHLSGGTLSVARYTYVGTTGGTHAWTVDGSGQLTLSSTTTFGNTNRAGSVTYTQNGGSVNIPTLYIQDSAVATLAGGTFAVGNEYVNGQLTQTGGTNSTTPIYVNNTSGGTGTVNVTGGLLYHRELNIGTTSNSFGVMTVESNATWQTYSLSVSQPLTIGCANGSGLGRLVVKGVNNVAGAGFIWVTIAQTGQLEGYGRLNGSASLPFVMNGRTIADGFGVDRTLDLSPGGLVSNIVDNTGNSGWYAVNRGKLLLPAIAVSVAAPAVSWGETIDDTTPDLVNSARLTFTGLSGSGTVTGAVLAVDRPEAVGATGNEIGAYEFGVNGPTFTTCDLTIRYDATAAAGKDNDLSLFRWTGSGWQKLQTTRDLANRRVTAANLTTLGRFALGVVQRGTTFILR